MGFKQAAVLAPVSFFLGVLFICLNVDHKLLFATPTEEAINDGFHFYTTFFNAPPAIKALLHALIGIGLVGLVAKLQEWTESVMFFDGSCLVAYVFSVSVYLTVMIPSLRTMVTPAADVTRQEQVEAMTILSAGNVIVIVCLLGILVLQAGQEYAARVEAREVERIKSEEKKKE